MGFFPMPGPGGGFPGGPGGPVGPGGPGFPGGAPGGVQAPTAPPPQFVPQMQTAVPFAIDPGGIRRCMFRNTYIWLNNGEQFWFFPVFVGRNSVAGFRWFGFFWGYFGIDLNRISSFTCF
ncbi:MULTISPECIES: collagen-like protein [Paenibacillus]|uniref:collagen-like protein n=1 Tax=Paenibacillus TaxID=44249 RepID=UPI001FFF028B|nr:collagen-like protein [Paenibacillus pabuli]UPK43962.1 collagen-like protein [Paenibacillus pabuli]